MTSPEPEKPPLNQKQKHIPWPLLANAGMMLLLYSVAAANSSPSGNNTALLYFFLLAGLLLLNLVAAIGAALAGHSRAAKEFLFSMLGIFLIGLGTCAYSWQHMQIDTR